MSWKSLLKTRMKQRKLQQQNRKTLNKKWRFVTFATFSIRQFHEFDLIFGSCCNMDSSLLEAAVCRYFTEQLFSSISENYQESTRDGDLNGVSLK